MKKECYKLLAAIILMLVATLTSCEKFSLDESGQSSTHDANANVTVRIHQVQNRTIGEVTKATTSGTALQNVCSRVSFVVFDGEEKIETINQASDDANFGIASFSLDEGEYRLVVIAHSGKGNCTMSVPEKVKFTSNKLTDTFYYYGRLSIKSDKVEGGPRFLPRLKTRVSSRNFYESNPENHHLKRGLIKPGAFAKQGGVDKVAPEKLAATH